MFKYNIAASRNSLNRLTATQAKIMLLHLELKLV